MEINLLTGENTILSGTHTSGIISKTTDQVILTDLRVIRIRESGLINKNQFYSECDVHDVIAIDAAKSSMKSSTAVLIGALLVLVGVLMASDADVLPFALMVIGFGVFLVIYGLKREHLLNCIYFVQSGTSFSSINSINILGEGNQFERFITDFIFNLRVIQSNKR